MFWHFLRLFFEKTVFFVTTIVAFLFPPPDVLHFFFLAREICNDHVITFCFRMADMAADPFATNSSSTAVHTADHISRNLSLDYA